MLNDCQLTYKNLDKKAISVAVDSVVRIALLPSNPVYSISGAYQFKDITTEVEEPTWPRGRHR